MEDGMTTTSTLSRRSIMTAVATIGAAAAVPALAEQVPIETTPSALAADTIDRAGMIARAEQIVDLLSNRYIREGWHESFDRQRAAQFIESVRRFDPNADDEHFMTMRYWMPDHGQSFDWLLEGDASGMICQSAKTSAHLAGPDPVFAAIDRYNKAADKFDASITAVGQYLDANRQSDGSLPEPEDHPKLNKLERRRDRAMHASNLAMSEMFRTVPTTGAGAQALVRVVQMDSDILDLVLIDDPDKSCEDAFYETLQSAFERRA
jgi:hypothetical protein